MGDSSEHKTLKNCACILHGLHLHHIIKLAFFLAKVQNILEMITKKGLYATVPIVRPDFVLTVQISLP